jgi:hypothetical protein
MHRFNTNRYDVLSPAIPIFILMYGMLFMNAMTAYSGFEWSLAKTVTVYGIALLWVVVAFILNRTSPIMLSSIDLLFGVFLVVLFTSMAMQITDGSGIRQYWHYVPLIVLSYICGRLMTLSDVRLLFLLLAFAGLGFLPLLIIEGWKNYSYYHNHLRPILFGVVHLVLPASELLGSAVLVFIAWVFASCPENWRGFLANVRHGLIAIGFLCVGLAYTAIRSALLATLCMVILATVIASWMAIRYRLIVLVYIVTLLSACLFLFSNQFSSYEKLARVLDGDPVKVKTGLRNIESKIAGPILGMESCKVVLAEQDSIAIRRVFYREAITMLFNRPVFGVGAGVFGNHSCLVSVGHAHSTILHVFAELGLVGGLPFLGFLLVSVVVLFRAFMHSEEQSKPILLGLIMLLGLHILVDQVQGNYFFSIGFYIFVGVAATIQSMRQQQLLALTRDSCE